MVILVLGFLIRFELLLRICNLRIQRVLKV